MNIKKRKKASFQYNLKYFLIAFLIPAVFLTACNEEPSFLGRDLLPPSDNINLRVSEITEIQSYTETSNPTITGFQSTMIFGTRNDQIFGATKADFILSYKLSSIYSVGIEKIDSISVNLNFSDFKGDSLTPQTIRIYELTDSLSYDSLYLSDFNPVGKFNTNPIAQFEIMPLQDSVVNINITDPDFLSKFEAADDSIFADSKDFEDYFYGLYFTSDSLTNEGVMQYTNIASANNNFVIAYTDTSGSQSVMTAIVTENIPKVNMFKHNFQGARINESLDNENSTDSVLFLKSIAGTNIKLNFPDLETWKDSVPIAINQAKLIIPIDSSILADDEWYPERCRLYYVDDDNRYQSVFDYTIDNSANSFYADGNYDDDENAYHFNIGFHLQNYLDGKTDYFNFVIIPANQSTSFSKVALKSPGAANNKLYLKIIYTRL